MRSLPRLICGRKEPRASCQPSLENIDNEFDSGIEVRRSKAMKKVLIITLIALAVLVVAPAAARAQGGAKQGPDVVRDPDMEKDSLHNLEVARQYFTLRKAYKASLARCEEIIAGNPTFSKIDEVLRIAGLSSLRLSENKGKQS